MDLLRVSGLWKKDGSGFELKDIHFTQPPFRKLAIAGATGSGKTTLLKLIGGLLQPDAGSITLEGKKVLGPNDHLIPGHPGIAYLSQQFELPHYLRVEQVLEYANQLSEKEAGSLFEVCRISHLLKRRTDQLSGGERQRIAIARLLIGSPKLLLLDEPFSNTDMIHKNMLKSIFHYIGEKLKISTIMISHDPLDTLPWADEILVLRDGEVVQHGSPLAIYFQPENEYVAGLFGNYLVADESLEACFPAVKAFGDTGIFRPENFRITNGRPGEPTGTVTKILFFGGYYELEILVDDLLLRTRTLLNHYSVGDPVSLEFVPSTSLQEYPFNDK